MHTVTIAGFQFQPATITVNRGDVVIWRNKDIVPHTATAMDKSFDSGNIQPGKSWRWTANKTGQFDYYCIPHPNMTGSITVR